MRSRSAEAIQADISKPEDVQQLFAKALKEFGQIGVVANHAGIVPPSPISNSDVETFDKVIEHQSARNVFGVCSGRSTRR
jgi:NAD(P)-dependent dehydrogenase (short-subunit alcohol dehydrogenase family)